MPTTSLSVEKNFDKQPDMSFTGSNTKMGYLLTFKFKGANTAFALGVEQVYVTLISEHVFELSESASTVLDYVRDRMCRK